MSEWISVKDRLPIKFQTIMLCDEENQYWFGFMSKGAFNYFKGDESKTDKIFTHWMNLPAAPKEQTHEHELFGELKNGAEND